jgi:hypothetical protein
VVLIATHMPAQYEQQTNKKLAVNGKWKTSQLTIMHEENYPMVQCKWHLIHSQVRITHELFTFEVSNRLTTYIWKSLCSQRTSLSAP